MALQVVFLQDKARLHRRCHVHAQGRPVRTVGPQQRRTLKSLEIDLCTTGTRDGVNLTSTRAQKGKLAMVDLAAQKGQDL